MTGGGQPPGARISNRAFAVSVALMLAAAFALSLVTLFGKELTAAAGLNGAVFLRFCLPFLILAWIAAVLLPQRLVIGAWRLHLMRALFVLGAQYCLFFYLSHGSLLLGTLLFSTSGLFLPFVTYFAYSLEIRRRTLVSILVSFAGVALILKPGPDLGWAVLIGLLAGFLNACSQAAMHRAAKQVSAFAATLTLFGLCSIAALAVLLVAGDGGRLLAGLNPDMPTGLALALLAIGAAVATISNQALRSRAYSFVNKPASLAPYYYAAIPLSGLLDWWFYGILPAWNVWLGMALILAGGVVMAWRGRATGSQAAS